MDIILSVKGISKTYTAGQVKINALNRCDIEVRKGEFTAIVGKSGSGKSTLLKVLCNGQARRRKGVHSRKRHK